MEQNSSELGLQNQEKITSKEELVQELANAKEDHKKMKHRASEFYDIELYDLFFNAVHKFKDADLVRMYIEATGVEYEIAVANYKKYEAFNSEQLQPLSKHIGKIEGELYNISKNERKLNEDQKREAAAEEYKKGKEMLEKRLYEALDEIHSKIPAEAKEVGMTTEAAIAAYLPDLVQRASDIEHFIEQIEKVETPLELSRIQEEIDFRNLFNTKL